MYEELLRALCRLWFVSCIKIIEYLSRRPDDKHVKYIVNERSANPSHNEEQFDDFTRDNAVTIGMQFR